MSRSAIRLAVSAACAAGLAVLVYSALPDTLEVRTDIVGYPTFANFNIDRYIWEYGLTVVFLPLVTLGLYLAFTRAFVGPLGRWAPRPPPLERVEAVPQTRGWLKWGVSAGRAIFVGAVLGFEVAVVWHTGSEVAVWTALAYTGGIGLGAWLAARLVGRELLDVASTLNALFAPLTVAALYGVSRSTHVTVSATGAVHDYPWLPAWLCLGVAGVLFAWVCRSTIRSRDRATRETLERRVILLVVAPVGLFLFLAMLPGALGTVDFFEEGQVLGATEIARDGAFPWRDLFVAHGLLHDVGTGLLGTSVFEDSRWGVVAGNSMLVVPIYWIALYYLCAYLFGTNWLYLFGMQLLVITGQVFAIDIRFVLLPAVLLLLAALLRRASAWRAVAFTSLLALQVIVTPEALPAAIAYLGTLVLFELYYYERGSGLAGFRRVWLCLATAVVAAFGWSVFLFANGALDDWAYSFTTLVSGHQLTGGIPSRVPKDTVEIVATVVIVLAVFAFVVVRTFRRRPLAYQDWLMVAMAGLTLLYFTKFLSRADRYHLYQSFSVTVPLLFYVGYRAITFVEAALASAARARGAAWFPSRHSVTAPLILVLLLGAPMSLADVSRAAPGHFAAVAPREPELDRIGFDLPGENDTRMMRDVSSALSSMLRPGETVFDFSNSPGLFYYLLDVPPSNRYYHVSLAIRQRTQADLVRLLEKHRPAVVVFTSTHAGRSLPSWDGISNQVRHYDVSQYLLANYVPVLDSHGFVLMRRRESGVKAKPELYFHVPACAWGYVPNFFTPGPRPLAKSTSLSFRRLGDSTRFAVSLPADAAEYGWLELRTGKPLVEGRFELGDRSARNSRRSIAFRTLDRGKTSVRLKVGACSQWRGYRPGVLYLSSSVPQDIRDVRLLR